MRIWIGAAVVAASFGLISPAAMAETSDLQGRAGVQVAQTRATEFSSRHRGRAHAPRQVRRHKYRGARHRVAPPDAVRPSGARPDGMAPFFPFGFGGYGFQPSW